MSLTRDCMPLSRCTCVKKKSAQVKRTLKNRHYCACYSNSRLFVKRTLKNRHNMRVLLVEFTPPSRCPRTAEPHICMRDKTYKQECTSHTCPKKNCTCEKKTHTDTVGIYACVT